MIFTFNFFLSNSEISGEPSHMTISSTQEPFPEPEVRADFENDIGILFLAPLLFPHPPPLSPDFNLQGEDTAVNIGRGGEGEDAASCCKHTALTKR